MAKITPSALITAIQGKWNGSCFQMWKGAIVVRRSPRPRKIMSESRYNFRGTVSSLSGCFYSMTVNQRIAWRCYALLLPTSVTGYNAFIARGTALDIADHSDLCVYFDAPAAYSPPISPAPIALCYHPSSALYCVMWDNPNCGSVYVQGMLSVQNMYSNENDPKWRIFDTVPSTDLHMIFDASSFPADQMIRFTARSINMRGETSIMAEAKPPPPLPESITLLYPIGGESLYTGASCLIEWRSKSTESIKIEYTLNNGVDWTVIALSVSAYLGQYNWTLPDSESAACKVKITNCDDPTFYDESDTVFSIIEKPWVTLTAPNGSEEWVEGSKHNITWNQNNVTNVILKYSSDNGLSYNTITASTAAAPGTYEWTVPSDLSTTCLVKILVHENQTIFDVSDNTFSITESTVISNIAYTSESVFHPADTRTMAICFLTDNKFVITYRDNVDTNPKSVVGTISDKSISYGVHKQHINSDCIITGNYRVSDSEFVVMTVDGLSGDNFSNVRCFHCTVSGSTITQDGYNTSPVSTWMWAGAGCGLSSTQIVCSWGPSSPVVCRAKLWNIASKTLTPQSQYDVVEVAARNTILTRLDDTHFLVIYTDTTNSNFGRLVLGTASGNALSFGSVKTFESASSDHFACDFYDSTHFLIAYRDVGDSNKGKVRIGTIDGAAITFSAATTFNAANTHNIDIKKVDSSTLLLSYNNNSTAGSVKIVTTSGHTISSTDAFSFLNDNAYYNKLAVQTAYQFLVAYRDVNDSNNGKIKIGYNS